MTLRVAATASAANGMARIAERGLLSHAIDHVILADDGTAPDGAGDVTVLWRNVQSPFTQWATTAIAQLPALRWIASDFVGVDPLPLAAIHERGIVLSNGRGLFSRPIAEWVVLHMLATAKQYRYFLDRSDRAVWERTPPALAGLRDARVLVIGMGSIGCDIAALLAPFGCNVVGAVQRLRTAPPHGVRRLVSGDAWRDELPAADFVVLAAPATERTRGMIDAAAFATMRPDAYLINIARGALVDERALVAALDEGRLAGAALDAFAIEPLPATSRLWGRPNVLVTPHHTWSARDIAEHAALLFAENAARFVDGRPLVNIVDASLGY